MSIELFANISIGHENDWEVLKSRVVAAAQCNADAIIISKATPTLSIPEHKKYVRINSKWGTLPYIEVAKKSEIDLDNVKKFNELIEQIGIPVIWSVTDSEAASWVKEHTSCRKIKIHYDAKDDWEVVLYCLENFEDIIYGGNNEFIDRILKDYRRSAHGRRKISLYHCASQFPSTIEQIDLSKLDKLKSRPQVSVGYESRCEGIFPDCAVVFKNIDFIEKHLGDEEEFNTAVLTPQKFYDFFVNMNQLEIANGKQD